uniref:Uncharacterized protein n=1 Tax=Panagrolaimus davidi TaxID=227884 RepID=A0A914PVG3_9BILA
MLCDKRGTQQQIRVYSTSAQINCSLRCPDHKSSFIIIGLLWNSVESNPWSTQAGNVTESSFSLTDDVTQILDFAQQNYT